MTHDRASHWQSAYSTKESTQVSWFTPHLDTSLGLLHSAGLNQHSRVLDVGAGASTLVDDLLKLGVRSVSALDLSEASLAVARARLGQKASEVHWIVGDVTRLDLAANSVDLWHDRAALHFLVDPEAAAAYVKLARRAIVSGGHAIIGCFASDGPQMCSGLPVARRDPEDIATLFGPSFVLLEGLRKTHFTPSGTAQRFAYALLRRT